MLAGVLETLAKWSESLEVDWLGRSEEGRPVTLEETWEDEM